MKQCRSVAFRCISISMCSSVNAGLHTRLKLWPFPYVIRPLDRQPSYWCTWLTDVVAVVVARRGHQQILDIQRLVHDTAMLWNRHLDSDAGNHLSHFSHGMYSSMSLSRQSLLVTCLDNFDDDDVILITITTTTILPPQSASWVDDFFGLHLWESLFTKQTW